MAQAQKMSASAGDEMLAVSRVFDAAPQTVFKAWTEPAQVVRWWGPNGFTLPVCEIDLKPGGEWLYCMRSPEGRDYWCKGVYQQIDAPNRILSTDCFVNEKGERVSPTAQGMSPDWPEEMHVEVVFAEEGGRTRLTVHQDVRKDLAESAGAIQGWTETLDRLAAHLASPADMCPMTTAPRRQHYWLGKLVGEWTFEGEAVMAPDQPPDVFRGTESVRSLGGLWVQAEAQSATPDGSGTMTSVLTLGYDPAKSCYVGTFIGSMMTQMWVYEGQIEADGATLTLRTEGPNPMNEGQGTAHFQDVIALTGDGRTLTSRIQTDDGDWVQIMQIRYRRAG